MCVCKDSIRFRYLIQVREVLEKDAENKLERTYDKRRGIHYRAEERRRFLKC